MSAPRDIDALVIDWLYDELDEHRTKELEAYLAAHPATREELEGLRRTRELMRELPVAEPPQAVSARLLHEAARLAPKASAERGGWLASLLGWLQPMAAHPALAAVACLVLVGGVAGTLYVRGQHRVAAPEVASRAPAPSAEEAVAAAPPAEAAPVIAGDGDESFADSARVARVLDEEQRAQLERTNDSSLEKDKNGFADEDGAALGRGRGGEPMDPATAKDTATRELSGKLASKPREENIVNAVTGADLALSDDELAAGDRSFAEPPAQPRGDSGALDLDAIAGGKKLQDKLENSAKPSVKAPAPPPAPGAKGGGGAQPTGGIAVTTTQPALRGESSTKSAAPSRDAQQAIADPTTASGPSYRPDPAKPTAKAEDAKEKRAALSAKDLAWAKTQHAELMRALRGKKCRDAARLANDILDRTPDYYFESIAGTKDIKPCDWYLADERQKRAAERAKSRSKRAAPPADQADFEAESAN